MQTRNEQISVGEPRDARGSRYYQVVFIWMKDPDLFGRYVELLRPVVHPYGGALERMLVPDVIYAETMHKPDVINIVFYDSSEAYAAFEKDPAFATIVHLRSASIEMASAAGDQTDGTLLQGALENRLYLVEVARYGPQGAEGYRHYEAQAEPVMRRYGYHVERRLIPDSASGFPFQPDLIKIAYFDSLDGMEQLHKDAAHPRIENELYPAAVAQSIWVVGRVHPQTVAGPPH